MPLPVDVLLCDYETTDDRCQLSAVLDELTLTYNVVERGGSGRTRTLRRHMPSLREARSWARATCRLSRAEQFPDQLKHRKAMTALHTESRRTVAGFQAILAMCRTASERDIVLPVAEHLAYHAGARLELACAADETGTTVVDTEWPDRTACRLIPRLAHDHRADVVAMTPSAARGCARRLLEAGTAVLVVPPLTRSRPRVLRIGVGYDGGRPAASALEIARALVAARPSPVTHMDVVYVDGSASGSFDPQEPVVSSRREAILDWWLEDVARQIPSPVRVSRPAGDAANELAQLSDDFDLLVVGTRGRAPMRRALTGSVSTKLVATTRCPLLIVPSATTRGLTRAPADERRAA